MGYPATPLPSFEELYEQIRSLPEHMTGEILEQGRDKKVIVFHLRRRKA